MLASMDVKFIFDRARLGLFSHAKEEEEEEEEEVEEEDEV